MALVEVDLPSPTELRPGWAAFAAAMAARGWGRDVYADLKDWVYHDGGGNWACLRFLSDGRAVLFGQDHEYSDTYFGEAATYFQEDETDLLAGAPTWWGDDLETPPCGEWIGFIYGWDGSGWQRAEYDKNDGFSSVGLLAACSINTFDRLAGAVSDEPLAGSAVEALIAADCMITEAMLTPLMPDGDISAAIAAAQAFLTA